MYFNDDEYFSKVFSTESCPEQDDRAILNAVSDGRIEEAYKQAADIRKFEIELFWKRGTYYWAFILAAFTAHFALLGMIFSTFSKDVNKELSLKNMCDLPGLSLFALAITAFFCFFFSLAWTLVNKGSKFWQKNWEAHIDMLEGSVTGKLHETYLNTNLKSEFNSCPFAVQPYDYSVTKITTLTSILLTIVSSLLFISYGELFVFQCIGKMFKVLSIISAITVICELVILIGTFLVFYKTSIGNDFRKNKNKTHRWYQRSETNASTYKT